jgi:hypothetical protein
MRGVKDENGKVWDIESAGTLAERNQKGDNNGVAYEEQQKLMHTPEGECFIFTQGKSFAAAKGDWQPYENVKPLSSDEAARELREGTDWKRTL